MPPMKRKPPKKSPMDKYGDAMRKAAKGIGKTGDTNMRNPKPAMGKNPKRKKR